MTNNISNVTFFNGSSFQCEMWKTRWILCVLNNDNFEKNIKFAIFIEIGVWEEKKLSKSINEWKIEFRNGLYKIIIDRISTYKKYRRSKK